jgi:hypothetical protein
MKLIAITAKEAKEINLRKGMETEENDGRRTFWATNEERTETWIYDSKKERDEAIERNNKAR